MTITYCGPSGGVKGGAFSDLQSAPAPNILEDSRISTVRIRSGLNIDSIQVTVQVRSTGQFIELPRRGGGGGGRAYTRFKD